MGFGITTAGLVYISCYYSNMLVEPRVEPIGGPLHPGGGAGTGILVLRLIKLGLEALIANRTEAALAPEGFSTPPPICTSVTIEVVLSLVA